MMAQKYIPIGNESHVSAQAFATLVTKTAMEVEGVSEMYDSISPKISDLFNTKKHKTGVEIEFVDGGMTIDVYVNIKDGFNVVAVAEKIQENVHNTIAQMASIKPKTIYVHVVAIDFE